MPATAQWSLAEHIRRRHQTPAAATPAAASIADAVALGTDVTITRFGAPGLCPRCEAPGYVRSVDVRSRTTYSCCRLCGTTWTATERRSVLG